jgi:hypothetical protein
MSKPVEHLPGAMVLQSELIVNLNLGSLPLFVDPVND